MAEETPERNTEDVNTDESSGTPTENTPAISRNGDRTQKDLEQAEKAEILSSLPEDLPAEVRSQVVRMMMGTTVTRQQAPKHPLFDKFTDDHVHKYLDYIQRDDDNAYDLRKSNRWFHLVYILIAVAFAIFLIVFLLPRDKALLNDFFKLFVSFAGGAGTGYGFKGYMDKKK